MTAERPKKGDRYVVASSFDALALTNWFAPYTGGDERMLPSGMEFVIETDPPATATAVTAKPSDYQRWEPNFVDEKDRSHPDYAGYYLVIGLSDLKANCMRA